METTNQSTTHQKSHRTNKSNNRSQRTSRSQAAAKAAIPTPSKRVANLLEWYSHLTERNAKHADLHYTQDAFFKDPLVEVYTTDEIQKHFLSILDKISDVRFVFENVLEQRNQAFVNWVMTARFMGREFSVQGASHLKFADSGLCEYHRDYYDISGEVYEQVPLFGLVFKGLKRVLN